MRYLSSGFFSLFLLFCSATVLPKNFTVGTENLSFSYWQQELQLHERVFKVYAPNKTLLTKAQVSFHNQLLAAGKNGNYLVMQLTPTEQKQLTSKGFILLPATQWKNNRKQIKARLNSTTPENLIPSTNYLKQLAPCYLTVEETYQTAVNLNIQYPQLTQWIDIGNSWEKSQNNTGYDLNVLIITNKNISEDKAKIFIQSAIHARELAPAQLTLDFATYLLNNYQKNADVTWLIDHREIHILFQANPDGRKMAEQNLLWRKNTNQNYCGTSSLSRGADLNRNFSLFWNVNNLQSTNSSDDECSEVFRGREAASEPETQAIEAYVRSLFPDERGPAISDKPPENKSGIHLDIHSFGRLLLWPWGHISIATPNNAQFKTLAQRIAFFNQYNSLKSDALYPTDGTSDNVSYGELGVAFLTFELGNQFFEPCANYESTIKPDNIKAFIYASKIAQAPYQLPSGPESSLISLENTASNQYTLNIRADDSAFYALRFPESIQNIIAAEYSIDIPFSNNSTSPSSMSILDGNANSPIESFSAVLNTDILSLGRHVVFFRAKDETNQWGPTSATFLDIGNIPPVVTFLGSCNNLNCNFDSSTSFSPNNNIIDFLWDFGDGSTSTEINPSHNYSSAATYKVSLLLTDATGTSNMSEKNISPGVISIVPIVSFVIDCQQQNCQFDASNSTDNGLIIKYHWDFGDGIQAEGKQLSHLYTRPGNVQVRLTLTNDSGNTTSDSQSLKLQLDNTPIVAPSSGGGGGGSLNFFSLIYLLFLRLLQQGKNIFALPNKKPLI